MKSSEIHADPVPCCARRADAGRRRRRSGSVAARWGVLLGAGLLSVGFAACGGLAADGGLGGVGGGLPFLSECDEQGCSSGFQCLEGVCTLPCTADSQCSDLTVNAECVTGPTIGEDGGGICAVPCSSDDGCRYLGAGSYCDFAFCVAGNLEALPGSFEDLELRRVPEEPVAISNSISPCDPNEFTTSIKVSLRNRRVVWSGCVPDQNDGSGFELHSSSTQISEAQVALILRAYRELGLSRERRCARDAEALTLDLEPEDGPELLFADDEHSSCPVARLQRNSYVSGLNDLYAALELVVGSFYP